MHNSIFAVLSYMIILPIFPCVIHIPLGIVRLTGQLIISHMMICGRRSIRVWGNAARDPPLRSPVVSFAGQLSSSTDRRILTVLEFVAAASIRLHAHGRRRTQYKGLVSRCSIFETRKRDGRSHVSSSEPCLAVRTSFEHSQVHGIVGKRFHDQQPGSPAVC